MDRNVLPHARHLLGGRCSVGLTALRNIYEKFPHVSLLANSNTNTIRYWNTVSARKRATNTTYNRVTVCFTVLYWLFVKCPFSARYQGNAPLQARGDSGCHGYETGPVFTREKLRCPNSWSDEIPRSSARLKRHSRLAWVVNHDLPVEPCYDLYLALSWLCFSFAEPNVYYIISLGL